MTLLPPPERGHHAPRVSQARWREWLVPCGIQWGSGQCDPCVSGVLVEGTGAGSGAGGQGLGWTPRTAVKACQASPPAPHTGIPSAAPSPPDSWGALLVLFSAPHQDRAPARAARRWARRQRRICGRFHPQTGTGEQCAFKTSRRAIVSPSLLLIVACFQPCFPVTFAGCEREQRSPSPVPAVPAGDGAAAPGPAQRCARSTDPPSLTLLGSTHPSCSSGAPLLLARPAVASSSRVRPCGQPTPPSAGLLRELRAGARGSAVGDALGTVCCLPGDAGGCRGIAWLPEHKVTATNTSLGLLLGTCPACLRSSLSGLTAEFWSCQLPSAEGGQRQRPPEG